ncbi:PEP-CTERM sorting domain-containing protein [Komarekiella sp. 'clone 1']|uniref:PEP-CTERM sorting domain-containing protein n=1 Tax=Komarekiella delphini-convector SJRDD-AB1 TaxID=2593771 RepID=A0AA40SWW4_9NOST|nr:NF038130 family PEP-CTERM protein [Komarekiella delphini-convector]MBD6616701.1 PEP-CTERM sorting domain-containing protein [Komarekiella delphini-convector SJRDD-AB1]
MKITFEKFVIGASIAIGVSALATVPAQAGTLTGATIGGTAASDYLVYDSNATNTFVIPNSQANVQKVLDGSSGNPTGNVELRASSEQVGFDFSKNTTLTGQIGGKSITLSSLTATDWFSTGSGLSTSYGAQNFANTWFNQFYNAAGLTANESAIKLALSLPSLTPSSFIRQQAFNAFFGIGGFQRSSDPNISYVNQNDTTGDIQIGLAGHYNLKDYYAPLLGSFGNFLKDGFQASEVVKVTYNDKTDFLYSFSATASGLTNSAGLGADGKSHSGNYEVTIKGVPPTAVPEPSVILGLLGVAGVFATQRKLKKASI